MCRTGKFSKDMLIVCDLRCAFATNRIACQSYLTMTIMCKKITASSVCYIPCYYVIITKEITVNIGIRATK